MSSHIEAEHWVMVHSTAKVSIGGAGEARARKRVRLHRRHQWHRLENPGKTPLQIIEVQIGSYLGEDDIVRTEDIYNRAPDETR